MAAHGLIAIRASLGEGAARRYLSAMAMDVPNPGEARARMQRVRVGVTGLAAVVLIVSLATAVATGVRRNASSEKAAIAATIPAGPSNVSEPAEPLAQLGVAPTARDDADSKSQPAAK